MNKFKRRQKTLDFSDFLYRRNAQIELNTVIVPKMRLNVVYCGSTCMTTVDNWFLQFI